MTRRRSALRAVLHSSSWAALLLALSCSDGAVDAGSLASGGESPAGGQPGSTGGASVLGGAGVLGGASVLGGAGGGGASANGAGPGAGDTASGSGAAPGSGAGPATGGISGQAGASTGGSGGAPGSCSAPLSSRLSFVDVATSVPLRQDWDDMGGASLAILAPRPSGGSVVGWWGSGAEARLHVTPLGPDDQRSGEDLVLDHPTNWFASVVADDAGVAALAFQRRDWWPSPELPNDIFFARWDAQGTLALDLDLGNAYSGFYRAGKLAYSAGRYMAYYPINNDPDTTEGGHEGDTLRFYDASGNQLEGGWDWGCSHSGDQRIFIDGEKVGAICDSDTYPQTGVIFMNGALVHPQPDATGGFTHVELGELVGTSRGYHLIFTTAIEAADDAGSVTLRPGDEKDVLLVELDDSGNVLAKHWITSTEGHETRPHIAAYGQNLLVLYGTGPEEAVTFTARVVSPDGEAVGTAEALDVRFAARDQLVSHPNGDVGWAAPLTSGGFRVYRLARCE